MLKPFPWQDNQWQQLQAAYAQGRLTHALLLAGADGIGLEQFAYSLAAKLLCMSKQDGHTACGTCKSCLLFQAGNHPDLLNIQPEDKGKQIKVDTIRLLIDYFHVKSQYREYKLAIISPAEAMNRSAANSLLKTLEEPPPYSLIILLSARAALLPVTIRSRCQRVDFPPNSGEKTVEWLRSRVNDKKVNVPELLSLAQGVPLKALEFLESDERQRQMTLLEDLEELRLRRIDPVRTAEKWLAEDAIEVLNHLLEFFIIMSRLKLGAVCNNSTVHRHLQRIIKGLDLVQLVQCYDMLLQHYYELTGPISLNKQGLLEDFIIHWQATAEQRGG